MRNNIELSTYLPLRRQLRRSLPVLEAIGHTQKGDQLDTCTISKANEFKQKLLRSASAESEASDVDVYLAAVTYSGGL